MFALNPNASVEAAVGATSVQFSSTLITSGPLGVYKYAYCSNQDSWVAQGTNPTASAGTGSMFVPAHTIVILDGFNGSKVAVIEDSTSGKASLTAAISS